jgi:hypothetical protein
VSSHRVKTALAQGLLALQLARGADVSSLLRSVPQKLAPVVVPGRNQLERLQLENKHLAERLKQKGLPKDVFPRKVVLGKKLRDEEWFTLMQKESLTPFEETYLRVLDRLLELEGRQVAHEELTPQDNGDLAKLRMILNGLRLAQGAEGTTQR